MVRSVCVGGGGEERVWVCEGVMVRRRVEG